MFVGWSKLCHRMSLETVSLTTKFPSSRRTASVGEVVGVESSSVDQIGIWDLLKNRDKAAPEILSTAEELSERGDSLFATHTTVLTET
ncbi:hypothetical protein LINGRAHAP2_LOCUS28735 [Linum grandiflorum]